MRGTPVLLQLFVLYYGIAAAVRLPAFVAAFLGLALNYAAYESEIYRSALEAVSVGQLEAARTLGFTERQVLSYPGAAGVPPRAGADDERLRRAAEGFVARIGADGDGTHQADADFRDQSRQLGDSRRALRGAVPGDVAAAVGAGAPAGRAMEGSRPHDRPVVRRPCRTCICDAEPRRCSPARRSTSIAARSSRSWVPSGSGKTTMLRAIAGLEPFERGHDCGRRRDAPDGPSLATSFEELRRKVGMVFQFHCLFEHLTASRTSGWRRCTCIASRRPRRSARASNC